MLDKIYRNTQTIQSLRNGPLKSYPDELAALYLEQGYSIGDIRNHFSVISQFSRMLQSKRKNLNDIDEKLIDKFVDSQRKSKISFISSGSHSFFKKFKCMLIRDGLLPNCDNTVYFGNLEIRELLGAYSKYLDQEKGLAKSSISRMSNEAKLLLKGVNATTLFKVKAINTESIQKYLLDRSDKLSTKHMQLIATCARTFISYLFLIDIVKYDLIYSIPTIRAYRSAHLPEYLDCTKLGELLMSCETVSAKGSRNYAILLLLVKIGFRASEVINLLLQDINWRIGVLKITGKGGKSSNMPLPSEVGEALSNYITRFRPKSSSRHVFLSTRAPFRKLSHASTISTIVRRQLHTAGIETECKGAHLMRYTAATLCLKNGGSLLEACELLRHFSIDTTAIYAKVDVDRLAMLAKPWPLFLEMEYVQSN